ncbi:SDR family oxidoreductase [Nocardioides jiangxiensis]|uniref:SDR family oxidoreductase n=1 Tax=Nocardioides jiangxiensis TaxID=3064524 RepID=A0ABT9AXS6_9ACTN|nr:SDR family oxidoreductase [Nocardioides sp. WY-20]MDO7867350.1 SDR family oxidoreductase [Nocardioides sp. WY-20]
MTHVHLLTGAGSGIGAAVASALHARGDELVLLARSQPRAHELQQQYDGARVVVADLADPGSLAHALAAANLPPHLDSVLHIAGVVDLAPVHDLDYAEVRAQVDVNLVAPMVLTQLCLPALRAARGTVVFVNSGAGLSAHPTWGAYAATKFGLRGFADALRGEEAEHGVRVTSVFPGRTATPMQEKVHAQEGADYSADRWIQAETVAASILHVLDLPRDAVMPEVSVRPGPR